MTAWKSIQSRFCRYFVTLMDGILCYGVNILLKWKWTEEDPFCWILIYTQILHLSLSLPLCLSFPLSRGQHVEHIRGLSVTSLNALVLCRCEDGIKRQLDCSEGWCLCYKVKSAEDGRTEQGIEVEHTSEGKRAEKKLICTKRGRATETKWHASQADSPSVITSTPLHRKQLRNTWARSACIMAYYKPAQPNICTKIINILQTDPKWIRLQNKQCSTCVVPTVTALFFLC